MDFILAVMRKLDNFFACRSMQIDKIIAINKALLKLCIHFIESSTNFLGSSGGMQESPI